MSSIGSVMETTTSVIPARDWHPVCSAISPALQQVAERFSTDETFRQNLRNNPADALQAAEILISPVEYEALITYMDYINKFADKIVSDWCWKQP